MDQIALCVGGMNANHMFKAPMHELAALQDHADVREIILDFPEAEGDVLRGKGHQRAWDLLKDHAESVSDIADQLLAQRKIDLTGYVLNR